MTTMLRPHWVLLRLSTTLAFASFPVSGGLGVARLDAQEVPSGVATELVDRAIKQRLDVSMAAGGVSAPSSPRGGQQGGDPPIHPAAAWLVISAAVAMLIAGQRGLLSRAHFASPAGVGEGSDDDPGAGAATDGVDMAGARASRSPSDPAAKPREELAIPERVLSILKRQAARRADASAAEPPAQHSGGTLQPAGFDVLVPGYDPWKDS